MDFHYRDYGKKGAEHISKAIEEILNSFFHKLISNLSRIF